MILSSKVGMAKVFVLLGCMEMIGANLFAFAQPAPAISPAPGLPQKQENISPTNAPDYKVGSFVAPIPGSQQDPSAGRPAQTSFYRRLPISIEAASVRLEELRNLMPNSRAKDFQDAVTDYLDWLSDLADAHWKLHLSFSKVESLKAEAEKEKQCTLKIGQLKRQAMLLKAEFLIREHRQPEALAPLVDIVVAEPKTETGESAYALLKQIGFAEKLIPQAPLPVVAEPVPASDKDEKEKAAAVAETKPPVLTKPVPAVKPAKSTKAVPVPAVKSAKPAKLSSRHR